VTLAGRVGDLDEELLTHGAEESLDLASSLGSGGDAMHQRHTEFRARSQWPGSQNSLPLSTQTERGTQRAASAGLSAAASRTVSSA
jgi:hypothetical protein